MIRYEYKVVPAPKKGDKVRGVKTSEDRYAHTLAGLMNELGAEGWEYYRTDTLPAEEKKGMLSKASTVFYNVLVFRRALEAEASGERGSTVVPMPERARSAAPAAPSWPESEPEETAPQRSETAETGFAARRRDAPEGLTPRLGPAQHGGYRNE